MRRCIAWSTAAQVIVPRVSGEGMSKGWHGHRPRCPGRIPQQPSRYDAEKLSGGGSWSASRNQGICGVANAARHRDAAECDVGDATPSAATQKIGPHSSLKLKRRLSAFGGDPHQAHNQFFRMTQSPRPWVRALLFRGLSPIASSGPAHLTWVNGNAPQSLNVLSNVY